MKKIATCFFLVLMYSCTNEAPEESRKNDENSTRTGIDVRWQKLVSLSPANWLSTSEIKNAIGLEGRYEEEKISLSTKCRFHWKYAEGRKAYFVINLNRDQRPENVSGERDGIEGNIDELALSFHEKINLGADFIQAYYQNDRGWLYVFSKDDGPKEWIVVNAMIDSNDSEKQARQKKERIIAYFEAVLDKFNFR